MLRNRQVSCQTLLLVSLTLLIGFVCGIAVMIDWSRLDVLPEPLATAVAQIPIREELPKAIETVVTNLESRGSEPEPISLDPAPAPYWDNVYVEYILDASGSMQEELDGVRKIDIAKEKLATKAGQLPSTTNVGLRVYGHRIDYRDDKEASCQDIELMVPPVRGGRDKVLEQLPSLNALGMTPLSESVIQSVDDFDYNDPSRSNNLIVISDGEETCGGDPCSMADELINLYNISFTMYVIAFDTLDNPTAQTQLHCLADKTGGVYLEANNSDELAQALDGIWDTMDERAAPAPDVMNGPATDLQSITVANPDQIVELSRLESDNDGVLSVAFSPDSQLIASSGSTGIIELWEVASGRKITTFTGDTSSARSLAFAPDGQTLLSGGSNTTIKLWEVSSGREVAAFDNWASVESVAFAPDGQTVGSVSFVGTATLWDIVSGTAIAAIGGVKSMAFAPDGQTLALGFEDGTVKLWEVASQRDIATFTGHTSTIWSVAFAPDGQTLASGSFDGTIKLWEVATGNELATLTGPAGAVSIAFAPNGQILASTPSNYMVKLSEVPSGREIATLTDHDGYVNSVAFAPNGRLLASGSSDGTVRLWGIPPR